MIRLLVCDDHALIRAGVKLILAETEITVVGEADSGEAGIEAAGRLQPDVVLLDLKMPGIGGLGAIAGMRAASPGSAILVLTVEDDLASLRQAFDAGAAGYLVKDAVSEELVAAVQAVARGRTYVHPTMGAAMVRDMSLRFNPVGVVVSGPGGTLSAREVDVLRELAMGRTNAEVAEKMFLSERTIENHRAHIFQKLGASTRADLVRRAIEAGLLDVT